MKFKAVYVLLVSLFVMILSLSILTGNTIYIQFVHLLQSSSSSAVAQSQASKNPTLSSVSPSPSSSSPATPSSSSLLPEVFQRVENSVVQITSTRSNPNQLIII